MKFRYAAHASTFSKQISANQIARFFVLCGLSAPGRSVKPAEKQKLPLNFHLSYGLSSNVYYVFQLLSIKIELSTTFTKAIFQFCY